MSAPLEDRFMVVVLDATQRVTDGILAGWAALARDKIKNASHRVAYTNSLRNLSDSPQRYCVGLPPDRKMSPVAWGIEEGAPAFDMKPGILKGRAFVNVPFPKTKMAVSQYLEAAAQGSATQAAQFATPAMRTAHITMMQRNPTLTGMDAQGNTRVVTYGSMMAAGQVPKISAHHTTDPMARMTALDATYKKGKRIPGGFLIWRRLGVNTDPSKWVRKAVAGQHLRKEYESSTGFKNLLDEVAMSIILEIDRLLKEKP